MCIFVPEKLAFGLDVTTLLRKEGLYGFTTIEESATLTGPLENQIISMAMKTAA